MTKTTASSQLLLSLFHVRKKIIIVKLVIKAPNSKIPTGLKRGVWVASVEKEE